MKIAILGYGNLGKGVEAAVKQNKDMELVAVFTRRDPKTLKIQTETAKVLHIDDILNFKNVIDVLIICGGSATDLPAQTPQLIKNFNVVDSFDTHAKIPEYYEKLEKIAKEKLWQQYVCKAQSFR